MKILIVDDHSLVREGLKAILSHSELNPHFLEAWDADTVNTQLEQHTDIALMLLDIQMPGCTGLELLQDIVNRAPNLLIIMLSAEHDSGTVTQALNSGASGFLPKNSMNQVLLSAIRLVLAGGVYIPREALQKTLVTDLSSRVSETTPTIESFGFTPRQIDVFRLLIKGQSNKQICREVDLAEATVKIHVRAILRLLAVNSRSEAIAKVSQLGLQEPKNPALSTYTP